MKLESISLCNNSIAVIPNQALASSAFVYLLLNGNPLETLPATLGSTARLYEVQVQFTKITVVDDDWIMKNDLTPYTTIYGHGAPLCEGDLGDLEERGVVCDLKTTYDTYHSLSYYTLEGKTAERTLR
ncbi:hypothetical protein Poli38472_012792 [Pythium oligandrum]|uniref:Uncharacterized protein n=1 Tax=Pythium oligandrum TaxID=41045 RepID=A0A8K1CEX7_PYTOL|nr:hypothetical protein Poli38472_012792 [Pythium oligandrum]|eukprot:TMW61601.1 hypothetical protein Poli38472_012792 [Pythium oligandrum]